MLEKQGQIHETFSCGLLHVDTPVLADQQIYTFISSVQTLDTI